MDKNLETFIKNHRISVVSILQKDNLVHGATMHFAFDPEKQIFYFMTGKNTKKVQSILEGEDANASLVIGFYEEDPATFQAEGVISLVKEDNKQSGWEVYLKKMPHRASGKDDEKVVLLQFIPTWGRFSDFRSGLPVETLLSDK